MSEQAYCGYCGRIIPNFVIHPKVPKKYHAYENAKGERVGINHGCWELSNHGELSLVEPKLLTASAG